jgi:hypothetical protein
LDSTCHRLIDSQQRGMSVHPQEELKVDECSLVSDSPGSDHPDVYSGARPLN